MVCHGNICRSTMAESMFTYMVNQRGVADQFEIDSAATSREEIGNTPHYGTVSKLREVGIPLVPHRARQMTMSQTPGIPIISMLHIMTLLQVLTHSGDISRTKARSEYAVFMWGPHLI